jgi:D-sedoheptulose 7-phosphate isomerase
MMHNDILKQNINEHIEVFKSISDLDKDIDLAVNIMLKTLNKGGKLIFCGNGGSASDSQHISAEFVGRFIEDRVALASISLTADTSALTCIGNDYGFENVFSRQIEALAKPEDCLIGISTSGNSSNVINAMNTAKKIGLSSVTLLGKDGGDMATIGDVNIIVRSHTTARIQESHIFIGHTLCQAIEKKLMLT